MFVQGVAKVWAEAGAEGVVIAGRRVEKLEEVAVEIRKLGNATVLPVRTDLKVASDVDNLFAQVVKTFGRTADVVVANAGWVSDIKPMAQEDVATWWSVHVRLLPRHSGTA